MIVTHFVNAYIFGQETKDASLVHLISAARKPEEALAKNQKLLRFHNKGMGSFTCTTNPSIQDLRLNVPFEGQSNYGKV